MSPQPQQSQENIEHVEKSKLFIAKYCSNSDWKKLVSHATPTAVLTYLLAFIKMALKLRDK